MRLFSWRADGARLRRLADSTKQVLGSNKPLWVTALSAIVALTVGLVAGRFVISPTDAAIGQSAPQPGLVTVSVERGPVTNEVLTRADVGYADASDITLAESSSDSRIIVTGRVPAVGDVLDALSVALEVSGRPVIVLPGAVPAYRTLTFGMSGSDVTQLKQALAAVGFDPGDTTSAVYDDATAQAVRRLYEKVGYAPPAASEQDTEKVDSLEESVRVATASLTSAEQTLASARTQGATPLQKREADALVASLQRQLKKQEQTVPRDEDQIADLRDQLETAELARRSLDAAPDTQSEQAAVSAASDELAAARRALDEAKQQAATPFPASEVMFLPTLPRRVDAVDAVIGAPPEGVVMSVSGATIALTASVPSAEAKLLTEGGRAFLQLPDGAEVDAKITSVRKPEGEDDRWSVVLEPVDLSPEQREAIQGSNVRVRIPVQATESDVLHVPYAALAVGAKGETRLEVVDGDPRDGDDTERHFVTVETGLAGGGRVEVRPLDDGALDKGDLVVVRRE